MSLAATKAFIYPGCLPSPMNIREKVLRHHLLVTLLKQGEFDVAASRTVSSSEAPGAILDAYKLARGNCAPAFLSSGESAILYRSATRNPDILRDGRHLLLRFAHIDDKISLSFRSADGDGTTSMAFHFAESSSLAAGYNTDGTNDYLWLDLHQDGRILSRVSWRFLRGKGLLELYPLENHDVSSTHFIRYFARTFGASSVTLQRDGYDENVVARRPGGESLEMHVGSEGYLCTFSLREPLARDIYNGLLDGFRCENVMDLSEERGAFALRFPLGAEFDAACFLSSLDEQLREMRR